MNTMTNSTSRVGDSGLGAKIYKTIAKNIKTFRKARGLSQEELARKLGLSTSQISKAEQAAGGLSIETLERLAKALKMPIDRLFRS